VNLHTIKSISFTKGLVIKKHLIVKEKPKLDDEQDEDEEDNLMGEREINEKRR